MEKGYFIGPPFVDSKNHNELQFRLKAGVLENSYP